MSDIAELHAVPDVSFIDGVTLEGLRTQLLVDYQDKYFELTGENRELPPADPVRLVLYAAALQLYQGYQYIDRTGKMDLLKYSYGEYLDNIAALKGLYRREATGAITTLRFTAAAVRESATPIPGGIRARDEAGNVFATDAYAEIPAGSAFVDVQATAIVPGKAANGLPANSIELFVDPVPYIKSVTNLNESSGGDDREGDDDLTYRVLMHPTSYSVAGPKEAYEYWARTFRTDIADVLVYTPAPTEVTVLFMLDGGIAPDATICDALAAFLRDRAIRPLTDKVTVAAPEDVAYTIALTYYVNRSDASRAAVIEADVQQAIEDYKTWQCKIGRDVNPSELIRRIVAAGAKRVELTRPAYRALASTQIAKFVETGESLYGGLEDD